MMFNSILPTCIIQHPTAEILLRPRPVISKHHQDYYKLETKNVENTQYLHIVANMGLQDQIRRKKVLSPTQIVQQDPATEWKLNYTKKVVDALVSQGASHTGLSEHIQENVQRVFECGDSSMQMEELIKDIIDLDIKSVEESRTNESEPKKHMQSVSEYIPGKVVHGNLLALLDMLSKHGNDWPNEETGIVLSRAFWFLHSNEKEAILKVEELGRGSFGLVELYHHNQTRFVKKQVKTLFQINEVYMTGTLQSPYIIKSFGLICQLDKKIILMEDWGHSMLVISNRRKFSEEEQWNLMFQGVSGLSFLDRCGIIHHDIKPENLLLKNTFQLKIGDFGAAKWSTDPNDMIGWTPEYLSPERAWYWLLKCFPSKLQATGNEDADITGKADVYALGLAICYPYDRCHVMLKYITEHKNITDEAQLTAAKHDMLLQVVEKPTLASTLIPSFVSSKMKQLLTKTLSPLEKRVTAEEAREFMFHVQSPQSVAETLLSLSGVQQPIQEAALIQVESDSSTVTQEAVKSPTVVSQQLQQNESLACYEAGQESAGSLQRVTRQIGDFNLQPQQNTISLSKSINPEKSAIRPLGSKVIRNRISTGKPKRVTRIRRTSDSATSVLSTVGGWTEMLSTINSDNIDDFSGPEALKRRMVKRKLQNKLPEAKKQRLHDRIKTVKDRQGYKSIKSQGKVLQNFSVESEQNTAIGESTDKCGGNMPDLDALGFN